MTSSVTNLTALPATQTTSTSWWQSTCIWLGKKVINLTAAPAAQSTSTSWWQSTWQKIKNLSKEELFEGFIIVQSGGIVIALGVSYLAQKNASLVEYGVDASVHVLQFAGSIVAKKYPEYAKLIHSGLIVVNAGQMAYLPFTETFPAAIVDIDFFFNHPGAIAYSGSQLSKTETDKENALIKEKTL